MSDVERVVEIPEAREGLTYEQMVEGLRARGDPLSFDAANALIYLRAQEELLEDWQQRAKRAEDRAEEVERPLTEQMGRLNERVVQLNEQNDRLLRALGRVERAREHLKVAVGLIPDSGTCNVRAALKWLDSVGSVSNGRLPHPPLSEAERKIADIVYGDAPVVSRPSRADALTASWNERGVSPAVMLVEAMRALREVEAECAPKIQGPSQHVAWLRYKPGNDGRPTTIHLCDSDEPGAFKVYRTPPTVGRDALLDIVNGSDLKAWALREIAAKALDSMPETEPACRNCGATERPDACSGGPWCAFPRAVEPKVGDRHD